MGPFTGTDQCSFSSLELVDWQPFSDITICFLGSGHTNLTDFCQPITPCFGGLGSWNDIADHYTVGCSKAHFFVDVDEKGASQFANPHEDHDFDEQATPSGSHALKQDTVSSISLDTGCTTG